MGRGGVILCVKPPRAVPRAAGSEPPSAGVQWWGVDRGLSPHSDRSCPPEKLHQPRADGAAAWAWERVQAVEAAVCGGPAGCSLSGCAAPTVVAAAAAVLSRSAPPPCTLR